MRSAVILTALLATATMPAAAAAQDARYDVAAFDVVGVKSVPAAEIERAVYPFAGPDRSNADLDQARAAVQSAYAARGFDAVLVELPPQDPELLRQGIVTIRVNEVPVGQVRVVDSRYHSLADVRAAFPSLVPGQPLNSRTLAADLEAVQRYPDREISPSPKVGLVPGTVDVDLRVRSTLPLHGSVELNDDTSPNTEDLRLAANIRYTNLWNLGHTVGVNYVVAPQNRQQQEVLAASYTAPIWGSRWSVLVSGFVSNSNVAALGGTNVLGDGYQFGARAIYRLPGDVFQTLSAGIDYKNFNQDIVIPAAGTVRTPIRYLPLVLEYQLAKQTENTSFDATATVTAGLRAIRRQLCLSDDATTACVPEDQFTRRTLDGFENFMRFNLVMAYSRASKSDFLGTLRFSGQVSDGALVTNEQFAVGGLTSVRGYFVSEAVGDEGANVQVEGALPSLGGRIGGPVDELRLFGFTDYGLVRIRSPLPGQTSQFELLSIGLGVKLRLFEHFVGQALFASPMLEGPLTKSNRPRFTFTAKGEF